jgi:hypothetical protein
MADNVLATWAPFLFDLKGRVWEVFPSEAPFLSEMSGYDAKAQATDHHSAVRRINKTMDGGRDIFSGKEVRHSIILAGVPGGGFVQEASTWNVPHALSSTEIHINLVRALLPFSISVDVERDSFDNSNATALATVVNQTRMALGRLENLAFLGDGTGLQVDITDGATSLATTCGTTANFDVLLPGTVWDILTRSTGADPGQGLRRKIASVVESTRVITWDTAQQASDGGTGNIVHSSTSGIYIPGSWSNSTGATAPGALCAQGLAQAAAVTGTFEAVDKAAVAQWQGTDGRGGDTTDVPLSDQLLDGGVRRGRRAGIGKWDFGLGDPAVIDLYKQGKYSQGRYDMQIETLKGGFSGIVYDGADRPFPLIKEPMHAKKTVRLIDKQSFQLYGDQPGPSFLEDDGAMFRRFSRNLTKEADLLDRVQLGVTKCNTLITLANLTAAA